MNNNNDGGRQDDIVNKVNNGIKDRKDKRANLQEQIKETDKQVDTHEDAKAEFSKDLPDMKNKLTALTALISEKHVKKIN